MSTFFHNQIKNIHCISGSCWIFIWAQRQCLTNNGFDFTQGCIQRCKLMGPRLQVPDRCKSVWPEKCKCLLSQSQPAYSQSGQGCSEKVQRQTVGRCNNSMMIWGPSSFSMKSQIALKLPSPCRAPETKIAIATPNLAHLPSQSKAVQPQRFEPGIIK